MQLEILVRGQKVRWKRDLRHSIWHKRDDEQMGNIPFYPKSGQSKALRPRAGGDLYRWNWKNHLFEGKNAISVQNHGFLQTSTDSTRINFMYGSRAPWNLGKLPWHTWNNSWCLPWALQAITQSCLSSVVTGGSVKHRWSLQGWKKMTFFQKEISNQPKFDISISSSHRGGFPAFLRAAALSSRSQSWRAWLLE